MNIDMVALENAIVSMLDESIVGKYNLDIILRTATIVWDGTAVEVKATDFVMVFDLISYECVDYTGYDA